MIITYHAAFDMELLFPGNELGMLQIMEEAVLALILDYVFEVVKRAPSVEFVLVCLYQPRKLYHWLWHRVLNHFTKLIDCEWFLSVRI